MSERNKLGRYGSGFGSDDGSLQAINHLPFYCRNDRIKMSNEGEK